MGQAFSKLMAQHNENEMVLKELKFLDDSSKVYKLVGPVLLCQVGAVCSRHAAGAGAVPGSLAHPLRAQMRACLRRTHGRWHAAQDLDEAKTTVEKRLQYIGDEMLFCPSSPCPSLAALPVPCRACGPPLHIPQAASFVLLRR